MPLSPDQIWQQALDELQLQLTGATFDTWLGRTKLLGFEHDEFTIGVHNAYAQDWLESRLDGLIKRTLSGIAQRAIAVKFVVFNCAPAEVRADPDKGALETSEVASPTHSLPEMPALKSVGFVQVSHYERGFWLPFLKKTAWLLWLFVRAEDKRPEKTEWTQEHRWSAPQLGRECDCGPQTIVGVNRATGRQRGALERLAEAGVGRYRRQGDARDPHTMYVISVRVRLPLLTPIAVMGLSDTLRHRHDQWLEEHGFDPREWFVNETV